MASLVSRTARMRIEQARHDLALGIGEDAAQQNGPRLRVHAQILEVQAALVGIAGLAAQAHFQGDALILHLDLPRCIVEINPHRFADRILFGACCCILSGATTKSSTFL